MLKSGIYKITSIIDGKTYIGSTESFNVRKSHHFSDLKLNKHYNKHLQRHYNKYGKESLVFEIIEKCIIDELISREQYYIDSLKPVFNGRKVAEANRGHVFSKEVRQNMSEAQRKWREGKDLSIKVTKEIKECVLQLKESGLTSFEISKIVNLSYPTISKIIKPISKYKFKLSKDNVLEIKKLILINEITLQAIADKFNINPSVVSNIKAGRLHKNIV